MTFTFDPQHPSAHDLFPPIDDYPFFDGKATFEPNATAYSPANAWLLAEISLLAYERRLADVQDRIQNLDDQSPMKGFTFLAVNETTENGCFILHNDACIIVAFRGTQTPGLTDPLTFLNTLTPALKDVITDLTIPLVPFLGGRVHRGFRSAYQANCQDLPTVIGNLVADSSRTVWFAGHSLGGALATLGAADFGDIQGLYTFGSPRVGDEAFAATFQGKQCFRVVHHNDIVTRLPPLIPPMPYTSVGDLVFIDADGSVHVDANPDMLTDLFAGTINLPDVIQSMSEQARSFLDIVSGEALEAPEAPTSLAQARLAPGPIEEHAPIYYAWYLKALASGA